MMKPETRRYSLVAALTAILVLALAVGAGFTPLQQPSAFAAQDAKACHPSPAHSCTSTTTTTMTSSSTTTTSSSTSSTSTTSSSTTITSSSSTTTTTSSTTTTLSIARKIVASNVPSYTEGNVVVSSTNSKVIVADYTFTTPFVSADSGSTWNNNGIIPHPAGFSGVFRGDQWSTMDQNGRVIVATVYNDVYGASDINAYVYSSSDGLTWAVDTSPYATYSSVYTSVVDGSTHASCPPSLGVPADYARIAADVGPSSPYRGNIYIVADAPMNIGGGCYLQNAFVRSSDGGNTWDRHLLLTPFADFGFIERIAIGPAGQIYFAKGGVSGIEFYRSIDGGSTFTVTAVPIPAGTALGNHGPSVGVSPDGSKIYMAYVAAPYPFPMFGPVAGSSVYLTSSADGGQTWATPRVISEPGAVTAYQPVPNYPYAGAGPEASYVTLTVTPTRVFAAWRDWVNSPPGTYAVSATANATYPHANYMGDYYGWDSTFGIVRLTALTGRFCPPPSGGSSPNNPDCTTVAGGVNWMDAVALGETVYVVYGIDADGNGIPDGNFVSLMPTAQAISTAVTVTAKAH